MAFQQDIATGATGISAWLLSIAGIIQTGLGIAVAVATLVALLYSVRLKRRQIKELDK